MENIQELLVLIESIPPERVGRELALRNALARAWSEGYDCCYNDGGEASNPYDNR